MIPIKNVDIIQVQYRRGSTYVPMGRLALKSHKIYFEYDTNVLELGLQLSPFKLPLKPGVTACEDRLFEGLFGVFNDSLPDGWGRLLFAKAASVSKKSTKNIQNALDHLLKHLS